MSNDVYKEEGKVVETPSTTDNVFKKRIIFIRHGNSIWNKAKSEGLAGKVTAIGQGVAEFVKTSYYDTASHKNSTIMDAPLSEIGIKQCKDLSNFLPRKYQKLQSELSSKQTYVTSHAKCNTLIQKASESLTNMLLPINQNTDAGNTHTELHKMQQYLKQAQVEMNTSISEVHKCMKSDIMRLDSLISIVSVLLQSTPNSVVVCSNLRRAISTAIICLWHRFESNKNESLFMMPCLQEIGNGVDSVSHSNVDKFAKQSHLNKFVQGINNLVLTQSEMETKNIKQKKLNKIALSSFEEECKELNMLNNAKKDVNAQKMRKFYEERLQVMKVETELGKMSKNELKEKDKMEHRKQSDKKIELFMDWGFKDARNKEIDTFVCVGHSHWIKAFFNKYLDGAYHEYKTNKLKNTAVVALDIYNDPHLNGNKVNEYRIMPESITTIYDGSL